MVPGSHLHLKVSAYMQSQSPIFKYKPRVNKAISFSEIILQPNEIDRVICDCSSVLYLQGCRRGLDGGDDGSVDEVDDGSGEEEGGDGERGEHDDDPYSLEGDKYLRFIVLFSCLYYNQRGKSTLAL